MRRLFTIPLIVLLAVACGEGREREQAPAVVFSAVELAPADLPALLAVLDKVLQAGDLDALRALYTSASRDSVVFSDTVGIGTAGTVDERLQEEFAAARLPHTNDTPRGIKPLKAVPATGSLEIPFSWPSGSEFSLVLAREREALRIDVLASPGGEILLINK